MNVQKVLGHDCGSLIDGLAGSVEDPAQHVLGDGGSEDVACELTGRLVGVDPVGALKHLDDGLGPSYLQDLASPMGAVWQLEVHNLGKLWELNIVQDDEGSVNAGDSPVGDPRLLVVVAGDSQDLVHHPLAEIDRGYG